jgi:hypothetical protein
VPDTEVNANYIGIDTLVVNSNVSAVPEPTTLLLVATGMASAIARRRRTTHR